MLPYLMLHIPYSFFMINYSLHIDGYRDYRQAAQVSQLSRKKAKAIQISQITKTAHELTVSPQLNSFIALFHQTIST